MTAGFFYGRRSAPSCVNWPSSHGGDVSRETCRPKRPLRAASTSRARLWQSDQVSELLRFPSAVRQDPRVDMWFREPHAELRRMAQPWFERMRGCGVDVRELLHDGHPVACVDDAAFGYVDAFRAHVNVGFFHGASLDDPTRLLEDSGKRMRHVKLRWGRQVDTAALAELIAAAYRDIRLRLRQAQ